MQLSYCFFDSYSKFIVQLKQNKGKAFVKWATNVKNELKTQDLETIRDNMTNRKGHVTNISFL